MKLKRAKEGKKSLQPQAFVLQATRRGHIHFSTRRDGFFSLNVK